MGDVMVDVVARPDGPTAVGSDTASAIRIGPGGSGANVAAWLATAGGLAVRFAGVVGDDAAGRAAAADLAARGVDARLLVAPGWATGTLVALVDGSGERTFLTDRGANSWPDARWDPTLTAEITHLHVSGHTILDPSARPGARSLIEAVTGGGGTVSVDAGSAAPLSRAARADWRAWTAGATLLLANRAEAVVLTGLPAATPAGDLARALADDWAEVVVTDGSDGAVAMMGGDPLVAAAVAVSVVDTIGAGDAFTAGWLAARLTGCNPAVALGAATRLAGSALGVVGGRAPVVPAGGHHA